MYIENLQTPHPIYGASGTAVQHNVATQPFIEAANLSQVKTDIANAEDYDTAAWVATDELEKTVHQTLRFPSDKITPRTKGETTFDTLRHEQVTNCIGYTAVASECLDAIGASHYVTYANGHWFVTRTSDSGKRLWLVDMHSPKFSQEITDAISRGTPASLASQTAGPANRGVVMLDTTIFAKTSAQNMEALESSHPWLTVAKQPLLASRAPVAGTTAQYTHDHTVIMSTFAPRTGRQLLHDYTRFQSAVTKNNLTTATEALAHMKGLYPEVDARAPHSEIRRLIKNLCALGEFAQAAAAADNYSASFSLTNDARLKELEGDMYRHISKASKDPVFAARSHQAYQEAVDRTRRTSSKVLGKVAASSSLAQQLADGS